MRKRFYQITFLVFLMILFFAWVSYTTLFSREQKAHWNPAQPIECLSYTAFQNNEAPWMLGKDILQIPQERVDADLELLSQYTHCIRIYSITGIEYLPALARKHHLKILFGIWINNDSIATEVEIRRAIDIIKQNNDVVEAVIVGNETLLRKEISPQQLMAYITQVKKNIGSIPVTYADVWEFWLHYSEVATAVDYVTIHILPYWEDDPVSISHPLEHIEAIYKRVSETFNKEVRIGETGWPSRGRMREGAKPSIQNQRLFLDQFLDWAQKKGVHYNIIEAFNQNWKRYNEGTVGGYWGIFERAQNTKPSLCDFLERLGLDSRSLSETIFSATIVIFLVLSTALFISALWTKEEPPFLKGFIFIFYIVFLYYSFGLVFDPRYREFPNIVFMIPALFLGIISYLKQTQKTKTEINLSWLLFIFIFAIFVQEGIQNGQALFWIGSSLVLALSLSGFRVQTPTYSIFVISLLTYFAAFTLRMSFMESHLVAQFCSEKESLFMHPTLCQAKDFIGMLIYYKVCAYFSYLLIACHLILKGRSLPYIALVSSMIGLVLYQVDVSALAFIFSVILLESSRQNQTVSI